MKMTKIIIMLAAFVFTGFPLTAQDTTKPFYFPHKTGDMWEYLYDCYSPLCIDTMQNFTIFDSVDSRGIIYLKQAAQFINPNRPSTSPLEASAKYWLDTVNNYVFSNTRGLDSSLIYKLNAQKGEQWIVKSYLPRERAIVEDIYEGNVLGKTTTLLKIHYIITPDTSDTTVWLDPNGYDIIADGFGLIYRGGGELGDEIHLIGAVINGTLYGDTTLVSVRDKKICYPQQLSFTKTIQTLLILLLLLVLIFHIHKIFHFLFMISWVRKYFV